MGARVFCWKQNLLINTAYWLVPVFHSAKLTSTSINHDNRQWRCSLSINKSWLDSFSSWVDSRCVVTPSQLTLTIDPLLYECMIWTLTHMLYWVYHKCGLWDGMWWDGMWCLSIFTYNNVLYVNFIKLSNRRWGYYQIRNKLRISWSSELKKLLDLVAPKT